MTDTVVVDPAEVLRDLLERRVQSLLSDDPPDNADSTLLHVIRTAAMQYSTRYLRSIMADKAADLLDDRIVEMELEGLDLDEDEGYCDRTMIGLGVRRVPSASTAFT